MGFEPLIPIFGILIVLVPIIGLTTVLTLRFGLKPFVESLAKELRGSGLGSPQAGLQIQVQDVQEQIEALAGEVRRLREARDFDARLLERRDAPSSD
jgi:hypothetical protein